MNFNKNAISGQSHSIILFDGVCNLCNGFVQFIIKRDRSAHFVFAPLQSKVAEQLLIQHHFHDTKLSTVILIQNNTIYMQSTAALKILKQLPRWNFLYAFIIIPRFIRDFFYRLIAKSRYKIFGKKEVCMVTSPELQKRFIG